MFLKIILLVALVRLLVATDKPLLCSGIYTAVVLLFGLIAGAPILALLIGGIIAFALSSLYFWLLYRVGTGILFWVILVGGLAIGIV